MVRAFCSALTLLIALPAVADELPIDDRTQAPYFRVSDKSAVEQLPLESTEAEVDVTGVIARVKVTQTYRNRGSEALEAVYVFPGSTRSAVFRMTMTIGERTIEAKIQEKEAARRLYEQAKRQGKSASLLEQHRPNVFQMNVANIMPGDLIKVEMFYTELLVPEDGAYEFVYPTVVGPRYAGDQGPGNNTRAEAWTSNPYLKAGKAAPYKFGLRARLSAGMPIAAVNSPSHRVAPRFLDRTSAEIVVDDQAGGNRDFVLRYKLAGKGVQTGLLMFPGKDENFFLLMMQPPKRLAPAMIPPREYIFVLDVSGSMRGFPLNTAKTLVTNLLGNLRRQDRFNIMFFSGGSTVLNTESVPATAEWRQRAASLLTAQRGGGGTRILPAMQRALKMPRANNMSTSIVVVTDGYVSVEKKTFEVIADNLGEANLFTFGIGRSVNRHLIEGMARVGMGAPFIVMGTKDADKKAAALRKYIESPVLTNVRVSFDGFGAYDVVPKTIPDVFADRPVIVFGKYRGTPSGHIALSGYNGGGRWSESVPVKASGAKPSHEALRQLWARHQIQSLDDQATISRASVKDQVTKLGLKYSLMTKYTSFIAVDSLVRNHSGVSNSVSQPLPVPSGVPQTAVAATAAPPPPPKYRPTSKRRRPPARRSRGYSSSASGGAMESAPALSGGRLRRARRAPSATTSPRSAPDAVQEDEAEPEAKSDEDKRVNPMRSVQRTLQRHHKRFAKCVSRQKTDPKVRYELHLTIGEDGRVIRLEVKHTKGEAKVAKCISSVVKRLRFESSLGPVKLIVPVVL